MWVDHELNGDRTIIGWWRQSIPVWIVFLDVPFFLVSLFAAWISLYSVIIIVHVGLCGKPIIIIVLEVVYVPYLSPLAHNRLSTLKRSLSMCRNTIMGGSIEQLPLEIIETVYESCTFIKAEISCIFVLYSYTSLLSNYPYTNQQYLLKYFDG